MRLAQSMRRPKAMTTALTFSVPEATHLRCLRVLAAVLIAALCVAGACAGPGAPIGPGIPREGGGTPGGSTAVGTLAFLVQPRDVPAGSAISPEVKVEALDTLGNVLTAFDGTVRVALG